MSKGGRREGAGRPRGSRGKRTQASIAQAETLGPTPLEVLLESMLAARAEGERAEAVDCAKAAAPYVHSKLAPTSPPTPVEFQTDYSVLSDAEMEQMEKLFSKVLRRPSQAKRRLRNLGQCEDAIPARFVGRAVGYRAPSPASVKWARQTECFGACPAYLRLISAEDSRE
jgi:hypothetical protein